MALSLKHSTLYSILIKIPSDPFEEKVSKLVTFIETAYNSKIKKTEMCKLQKFVKMFDVKWSSSKSDLKFLSKYSDWLDNDIEFSVCTSSVGAPHKSYEDLSIKTKRKRMSNNLSVMSTDEVSDTFKALLKQEKRPTDAIRIADVLPKASPKRLKRIVESIPTPSSESEFTDEEAIALMLQLGLSRDNYIILRKALKEKGVNVLPSYDIIKEKKKSLIPSPLQVSNCAVSIELSNLLENTAARIVSTLSKEQLKQIDKCDLQLMCKWGCDGLSTLSEYKQASAAQNVPDYRSIFMASLVPLRIRKKEDTDSPSTSFHDVWINSTPGSKSFCRPICFEYTKESAFNTQKLVDRIEKEIKCMEPITIAILDFSFTIGFIVNLTMIDGKVCNAITGTSSTWRCPLCGETKAQFSNISKEVTINKDALKFGISPLHARIRFLEHFLHIAYDLDYHNKSENANKPVDTKELKRTRDIAKKRIQEEFKTQTGLNIDKPLSGYGNTNDGNTARRFFKNYEITSKITGIDMELLRRINIILMAINSKHKINPEKFGKYCLDIIKQLITLYPWKDMTPTVHKVLRHGEVIIAFNILPLGELTEEPQEARNRDFRHIQQFHSRKCSRESQNEDIFKNLLLSSDPVLSSMRKRWICYSDLTFDNTEEFKDLLYLLDMDFSFSDYFTELS